MKLSEQEEVVMANFRKMVADRLNMVKAAAASWKRTKSEDDGTIALLYYKDLSEETARWTTGLTVTFGNIARGYKKDMFVERGEDLRKLRLSIIRPACEQAKVAMVQAGIITG